MQTDGSVEIEVINFQGHEIPRANMTTSINIEPNLKTDYVWTR